MKKINLLILILFLLFMSCSKDKIIESFSVNPTPYDISQLRLFTKQGEVTDQNIINDFFNRHPFDLPEKNSLFKDLTGSISGNSVETTFYGRTQQRKKIEFDEYEVWENKQHTIRVYYPYDLFKYQRLRYVIVYDEDYPNSDKFATETFNDCFFVEKFGEELTLPMISARFKRDRNFHPDRYNISYIENNSFQANFVPHMNEQDTILFQTYRLKLIMTE